MINENSLVTAAHCGDQPNSYWDNAIVIYQENQSTWRCLTNTNPDGTAIRGSRNDVISMCSGRRAGFGSLYDNGTSWQTFPGDDPGESWYVQANDFAVVKIWDPGFSWVGVPKTGFAAIYNDTVSDGKEWVYGTGIVNPGAEDPAVRRTQFDVVYHDDNFLGAFGTDGQVCSGDSGGPMGVFLPESNRFAVVGVTADVPEPTIATGLSPNPDWFCQQEGGPAYWVNATTKINYIETAIGKSCRTTSVGGISAKECWD